MWRSFLLALVLVCRAGTPSEALPFSRTIDNTVTGSFTHHTWDPADPLTISGTLLDNINGHCQDAPAVPNVPNVEVDLYPAPLPFTVVDKHVSCSGQTELFFSPGTNANGHFSIPVGRGGGCSWITGNGVEDRAAYMKLTFTDGPTTWEVTCGDAAIYPLPGCPQAPTVYGVLASPDLNANLTVDSSDWAKITSLAGMRITLVMGWQADFNHLGPNVDASDLAYMAARLGKNCFSQKMEAMTYDADIHNLELDYVKDALERLGITKVQILAAWDEIGFSYDRSALGTVLSADDPETEPASWSTVKRLYRD